jgi:hypothetical protein
MAFHAQRGALFENLGVTEFLKGRFNRGQQADLYFWRDSKGLEVDLLLDDGLNLTPVEIKSGQTIAADSHIAFNIVNLSFFACRSLGPSFRRRPESRHLMQFWTPAAVYPRRSGDRGDDLGRLVVLKLTTVS